MLLSQTGLEQQAFFAVSQMWFGSVGCACCQSNVCGVSGLCLLSVKCGRDQWTVFALTQMLVRSVGCVCRQMLEGSVAVSAISQMFVGSVGYVCCQSNVCRVSGLCLLSNVG